MTTAAEALGPGGCFADELEHYEVRSGQIAMAAAVEAAFSDERILICEAGTGTGKSLAYLVPAVLSGKKVVVSTATRALQEQLIDSDVPLLARALSRQPQAAVMKGLSNYICLRRLAEYQASFDAERPANARSLRVVSPWVDATETGDTAELATLSEGDPVLSHVTSSSETRIGPGCPYFEQCFVTRMKRKAERARLVIANHHLYLADVALRGPHPGRVLPAHDAVVFDEAHQLEDIATAFFGLRVSRARIRSLVGDARRAASRVDSSAAENILTQVEVAAAHFWDALLGVLGDDVRVSVEPALWRADLGERWHHLDECLEGLMALSASLADAPRADTSAAEGSVVDALDVVQRRSRQVREDLAAIIEDSRGRVVWCERDGRGGVALTSTPVDLSATFALDVFEALESVVLTSATLANGQSSETNRSPFSYFRSRVGLEHIERDVVELIVESPFDFASNAVLYGPDDLPPPGAPGFPEAALQRVIELVRLTGGGAFVLTTSIRSLRFFAAALAERLSEFVVLSQGQAPKSALLDAFRVRNDAVLVATMSFWEGVDIPGPALRLVVIEKIPFAVPSDPVVRARSLAMEAEGRNPFIELHVPAAAITLKQGFGRLIRTRSDRGIVALLDERAFSRGYSRQLLSGLPPAAIVRDIATVARFADELRR